jgi:hypothetical protein
MAFLVLNVISFMMRAGTPSFFLRLWETFMNRRFNRLFIACIVTAFGLMMSGCKENKTIVGADQIFGSGKLVTQHRNATGFTGTSVTNIGTVVITQDTVEGVTIETDDNILDRVKTQIVGNVLYVGLQDGSYKNVTLRVYVSVKEIELLEVTGAGDFSVSTPIHVGEIVCRITGAGTITLAGTSSSETVEIQGAGTVNNIGLVTSRCSVVISGTGNVEVNVTDRLDATITGTGSIIYAGNPPVVNQTILGVGSIRPQ